MPTPAEQKALAFIAIVILLGGTVRVVRAGATAPLAPTAAEQQGLARQAFAASSAATDQRLEKAGKSRSSRRTRGARVDRRKSSVPTDVGGVVGVPFSSVRPDRPSPGAWPPDPPNPLGFPPPLPRIDVGQRDARTPPPSSRTGVRSRKSSVRFGPIDLDSAAARDIETLPRIGPALARRIVASRDSLGPFRTLSALRRVRGIGPATLELLAPLVTFSGQTRP